MKSKSALLLRAFRWIARRRLSRGLDGVFVKGVDRLPPGPVVFAANHVSYWDSFLLLALDELIRKDGYVLMDEHQLERFPFFGLLGALPLDRGNPRRALGQLRSATEVFKQRESSLWCFPQGEYRPPHLRPLGLRSGVFRLTLDGAIPMVPVSIGYFYREHPEPVAAVVFGDPVRDASLPALEQRLIEGLEEIDRFSLGKGEFSALIPGRERPVEDGLLSRSLAWMTRRFA